jgi:hypothetical protein
MIGARAYLESKTISWYTRSGNCKLAGNVVVHADRRCLPEDPSYLVQLG